jgi:fructose-1,6-bisphosphatase/inositol monophosphatase family enzyme
MGNEDGAVRGSATGSARPGTAAHGPVGAAADLVGDDLLDAVEQALREVAAAEVLPRWRRLADTDIAVKTGPYDLVTTADRLAEERLTQRLTALLPGSVVVGEEAVSADPGVLGRLHGDAPVWVIDPVDGTAAFIRGEDGFAMMVALVSGGETVASWTYAPRLGLFATARRGRGAHLDGRPLHTATGTGPLRLWTSSPVYRTAAERARLAELEAAGAVCMPCGCAGLAYVDVARGASDGVAFFWELPWDHAAGLLLVTEAGGASLTAGGEPFRVAGGNELPFTAARDAATAARVAAILTREPGEGPAPALPTDGRGDGADGGECG